MATYDIFSKRLRREQGETPDVYSYDEVPRPLRVQVLQIMYATLGQELNDLYGHKTRAYSLYDQMRNILRKELGVFLLPPRREWDEDDPLAEFAGFLMQADHLQALDAIELICRGIDVIASKQDYLNDGYITDEVARETSDEALSDINERFSERGVGYEYDGKLIRIDSKALHKEAVKPALELLRSEEFAGADQEYRSAFEHYRNGKTKEALTDALKSLESTMKVICHRRGWTVQPSDTAKKLIEVCMAHALIPTYWQNHFASLRAMLEGSVPTARNKASGHGQGLTIQAVPGYLASYVLHMTASTIVFLVEADKALP